MIKWFPFNTFFFDFTLWACIISLNIVSQFSGLRNLMLSVLLKTEFTNRMLKSSFVKVWKSLTFITSLQIKAWLYLVQTLVKALHKKKGLTMRAGVQITMLSKVESAISYHGSRFYQCTASGHESKVKLTMIFNLGCTVFIAVSFIIACLTIKACQIKVMKVFKPVKFKKAFIMKAWSLSLFNLNAWFFIPWKPSSNTMKVWSETVHEVAKFRKPLP